MNDLHVVVVVVVRPSSIITDQFSSEEPQEREREERYDI